MIRYRIRRLHAVVHDGSIERVPEPDTVTGHASAIAGQSVPGLRGSALRRMVGALVLMHQGGISENRCKTAQENCQASKPEHSYPSNNDLEIEVFQS